MDGGHRNEGFDGVAEVHAGNGFGSDNNQPTYENAGDVAAQAGDGVYENEAYNRRETSALWRDQKGEFVVIIMGVLLKAYMFNRY